MLSKINSPKELKNLKPNQLPKLSREIRRKIISTVSKTGGHLASSLGATELTVALHYSFNSPKDKIIWDVGHQAYAHKLLTGRQKKFDTLRQYQGISGFPKREESEHDIFNAGHASTSLSAALGIAEARDQKNQNFQVIPVIGDGALTGGMAWEAMNQIGYLRPDMIAILNDNEMSISPNVGALSKYLNRLIVDPNYNKIRRKARNVLNSVPLGRLAIKTVKHAEESVKAFLFPSCIFEDLGFKYIGPIDGHNVDELLSTFQKVKLLGGPVLVHVITKKGKGYKYAEDDATKFHGISSFKISDGEKKKKAGNPSYTEIFSQTLNRLAAKNKKIVAVTAAMPDGTGLSKFKEKFPSRFYDVGICEEHAVTFAAGLAHQGLKPVCAIYSTFLQRAYDQIVHDVALQNLPVTFMLDRGGLVGDDGPTHHGCFDYSYLRHIPNMAVMAPKDENEFQHMIKTAEKYNGPIACRYPRGEGYGIKLNRNLAPIKIGQAEKLMDGKDLSIIAIGSMVYPSMQAALELHKYGIHAQVINARFVKPLDKKLIKQAAKCGKIITVEENTIHGGFGSAINELLSDQKDLEIHNIGIPDQFIEHGGVDQLKQDIELNTEGIVKKVLEIFNTKIQKQELRNFKSI